jgi:hypothetical protein
MSLLLTTTGCDNVRLYGTQRECKMRTSWWDRMRLRRDLTSLGYVRHARTTSTSNLFPTSYRKHAERFPHPCSHATLRSSCNMTKSPDQAPSPRNTTLVSAWMQSAVTSPTSPQYGRPRLAVYDHSSGRSVGQRDSLRDLRATICEVITLALEEVPGEGIDPASAQRGSHLPSPSRRPPRDDEGATN